MTKITGKIGLALHEIQMVVKEDDNLLDSTREKINLEASNIVDLLEEIDDEFSQLETKISEKRSQINSLEDEIGSLQELSKRQTLPNNTLTDGMKNKIFMDIHHNLGIEQVEQVLKYAQGMLPKGILWKEKL